VADNYTVRPIRKDIMQNAELLASSFAVVGLGAAPGKPDSATLRGRRSEVAQALAYLAECRVYPCQGTYDGVSEPGILLTGPLAHKTAIRIGEAIEQESVFLAERGIGRLRYLDAAGPLDRGFSQDLGVLRTVAEEDTDTDYTDCPALRVRFTAGGA
jgi:hypothetical protein